MTGFLSLPQRDYVLFHLGLQMNISAEIRSCFYFDNHPNERESVSNRIIFSGCEHALSIESIRDIDELPVLFPVTDRNDFFYIDELNNLVFSHDLLKSVFYLLSGYQEYSNTNSKDQLNRFSFSDAIQNKLNITHKPLVNYYLNEIEAGICKFCELHNLSFAKKRLFDDFGFLLSHDIDVIDTYTLNYFLFKFKEVLHLKKSRLSTFKNLTLGTKGMLKYFGILTRDNPYWNFDFLRTLERRHNFKSTFYFLDKDVLHNDAYYTFGEKRLTDLYASLKEEGCEIGLHGSVRSIDSASVMKGSLDKLNALSRTSIVGIRQHRLLWKHPQTAIVQQSIGLQYDTTLGFAAHEGFRNSYCGPFRLYDFANDRMLNLWEFPLNVMDVTLFAYRNYTPETALEKCNDILEEVRKFHGIFTLLWHNSFFDEDTYPGVTKFYADLLDKIAHYKPENPVGSALVERLNDLNK